MYIKLLDTLSALLYIGATKLNLVYICLIFILSLNFSCSPICTRETLCTFCVTTPSNRPGAPSFSPGHHYLLPQSWPWILQQMVVANVYLWIYVFNFV